jgi:hypothetical protein
VRFVVADPASRPRLLVLYRGVDWRYLIGFDQGVSTGVLPNTPLRDVMRAQIDLCRIASVYASEPLDPQWREGGQGWWMADIPAGP